jgi:hypothetical protein
MPTRYHHTRHTRAQTHTTRQAPASTTARQHHGASPKTAHANKTTHATSHTRTQQTNTRKSRTPKRPHAKPRQLRNAKTVLYAHRRTHATHSTAHSSANPTHRSQKITPSHTRGLSATLTPETPGCPASTGCCRRVGCCSTTTACRTHDQPSRHTIAPDATTDPSQPPTTHRSASHNINQVKSNESQSVHCMLALTHNTVCE